MTCAETNCLVIREDSRLRGTNREEQSGFLNGSTLSLYVYRHATGQMFSCPRPLSAGTRRHLTTFPSFLVKWVFVTKSSLKGISTSRGSFCTCFILFSSAHSSLLRAPVARAVRNTVFVVSSDMSSDKFFVLAQNSKTRPMSQDFILFLGDGFCRSKLFSRSEMIRLLEMFVSLDSHRTWPIAVR